MKSNRHSESAHPAFAEASRDAAVSSFPKTETAPPLISNALEFMAFIDRGASQLTPREFHQLVAELPEIRDKFPAVVSAGFPGTVVQLEFLAEVVEAFALQQEQDLPYRAALDGAFALLYFHRDIDLIPDSLGAIGYVDDAAVISAILVKHADVFHSVAKRLKQDWRALGVESHGS